METNISKSLHLLFVDDDTDESYLFNEALEQSGLDVKLSRAKDGNDLISFLKENPLPDIVLVDLNMPHKDGLEALAEIRNDPSFNKLPLVIYSTTKNNAFIEQCYKKGADLFVVKPNSFDGMLQVVKTVCSINWREYQRPLRQAFVLNTEAY